MERNLYREEHIQKRIYIRRNIHKNVYKEEYI